MTNPPSNRPPADSSGGEPSAPASLRHGPTQGLYRWITHTELASACPAATKAWCAAVLSDKGGGIRKINPPEAPGMEGVTVAIVRAPGGVPIGFSAP